MIYFRGSFSYDNCISIENIFDGMVSLHSYYYAFTASLIIDLTQEKILFAAKKKINKLVLGN